MQAEQLMTGIEAQFETAMDTGTGDERLQGTGGKFHPAAVLGDDHDIARTAAVVGKIVVGGDGEPKADMSCLVHDATPVSAQNCTLTQVPAEPGASLMVAEPPCILAISRTIAKPSPLPSAPRPNKL